MSNMLSHFNPVQEIKSPEYILIFEMLMTRWRDWFFNEGWWKIFATLSIIANYSRCGVQRLARPTAHQAKCSELLRKCSDKYLFCVVEMTSRAVLWCFKQFRSYLRGWMKTHTATHYCTHRYWKYQHISKINHAYWTK